MTPQHEIAAAKSSLIVSFMSTAASMMPALESGLRILALLLGMTASFFAIRYYRRNTNK